jgi:hypothetical protein
MAGEERRNESKHLFEGVRTNVLSIPPGVEYIGLAACRFSTAAIPSYYYFGELFASLRVSGHSPFKSGSPLGTIFFIVKF